MLPELHLVKTADLPIFEQLKLEEALLRADHRNWCLINEGSLASIVMGISGKAELLIDQQRMRTKPLPLVRRFSGGGTVVVDENTIFLTFICQNPVVENVNPQNIMRWTESFYRPVFKEYNFNLIDNDYVLGSKKFGGNAQYLCKNRWLHHTSFLWGYAEHHMNYLLMPRKTPAYRQGRSHENFLCRLQDFFPTRGLLIDKVTEALGENFCIKGTSLLEAQKVLDLPHRKATVLVDFQ